MARNTANCKGITNAGLAMAAAFKGEEERDAQGVRRHLHAAMADTKMTPADGSQMVGM